MSHRVASKVAVTCFIALGTIGCLTGIYKRRRRRKRGHDSYEALIGNTPFLKLEKLSALLGQGKSLYVKMECMNPGGSGKDRAALYMIQSAEENEELPLPLSDGKSYRHQAYLNLFMDVISSSPHDDLIKKVIEDAVSRTKTGGIVIEGSSGSTGISLATLAARRGHSAIIVMPDDQAQEKRTILSCLGASVHVVPTAAISNPNQYVNVAKRVADIINVTDRQVSAASQLQGRYFKAAFMNQFENMANYKAHYATTGPEILSQSLEAFGKSPDACKYRAIHPTVLVLRISSLLTSL
jgi:cysteine synthase A